MVGNVDFFINLTILLHFPKERDRLFPADILTVNFYIANLIFLMSETSQARTDAN